jgi:hypothetical protein
MRHARHEAALRAFERATIAIPGGTKHIVIVYDGPNVPVVNRLASFISDAPKGDVALICKAVANQIDAE